MGKAKETIKLVLNEKLEKSVYEISKSQQLSQEISEAIKTRIKELNIPDYKISVQTILGEDRGQGI